jgi:mannose-6-phosphate isomerase-like protein (cupin superfamily)
MSPVVIENPVSGERIVIRTTGAETGGELLTWELFLAPDGRVPSGHAHPEQEERFRIVDGHMRFRLGWHTVKAGPGDVVTVPPGRAHSFSNVGNTTAHVVVETRPALAMQALLETAASLSTMGGKPRRLPSPVDLVLFMREFRREVRAPFLPRRLVELVVRPAAWIVTRCGLDSNYRRFRLHDAADARR